MIPNITLRLWAHFSICSEVQRCIRVPVTDQSSDVVGSYTFLFHPVLPCVPTKT